MALSNTPKPSLEETLFEAGVKEGKRVMQVATLDFLQEKYMDKEVARDSEEGKAILSLVKDLAKYLNGLN